jgi:hypothetical protein
MKVILDDSVYGACGLYEFALLTTVGSADIGADGYGGS